MPLGRWLVFDTNVYIAAIRGGIYSAASRMLQDHLPRTYLASVVAAELRAGAQDEIARRDAHHLGRRFHGLRRVVTPGATTWERAGDLLAEIRHREPHLGSKNPRLWNDLLIALSARQIGATVVTHNAENFRLLRRYVRFDLHILPT